MEPRGRDERYVLVPESSPPKHKPLGAFFVVTSTVVFLWIGLGAVLLLWSETGQLGASILGALAVLVVAGLLTGLILRPRRRPDQD